MKKILLIILYFLSLQLYCCKKDTLLNKNSDEFKNELTLFVNTIKTQSIGKGKYNVFVANIYSSKESVKDFCFTLGYILNEYEFDDISPDYVYYFNNEIVLIRIDEKMKQKKMKDLCLKKITIQDSLKIIKKLYPLSKGGITYTSKGFTYCNKHQKKERINYENSDEIPFEKSIYKSFKNGEVIEIIYPK